MSELTIGVLTVSDRTYRGESADLGGPKVVEEVNKVLPQWIKQLNATSTSFVTKIVPDEVDIIVETLLEWCKKKIIVIFTTGGTGFAPRDVTPEATRKVIQKEATGISSAMMFNGLKFTPHAMLSRSVAGIRENTLIVNLPGSPKAVAENLQFILPSLGHGIALLREVPAASKSHTPPFHVAHSHEHSHDHSHDHSHKHSHELSHGHGKVGEHSHGRRESPWPMVPVGDAQQTVLKHAVLMPTTLLPLKEAVGYVVAEDVFAKDPLPPFRASVKDGYAIKAKDGAGVYPVIGTVTAGQVPSFQVTEGTIARITTGSPLPEGADAVIMVERTELLAEKNEKGQEQVKVLDTVKEGNDVRPIGCDIATGELILKKGDRLGPSEIGLLATVGVDKITVYDLPTVAVLSTGDELVEPDKPLPPACIRDSNRSMLMAALKSCGHVKSVVDLGIAKDTKESVESKIREGLAKSDILITTGGVSMGELDLLQPFLQQIGTVHFGRVLMKPSKPTTFATVQVDGKDKLVFGLPGNPVSGMVAFYVFCLPAFRKMIGFSNPHLPKVQAKLAHRLQMDPERPEYHRCELTWQVDEDGYGFYLATSTGKQASSRLMSMRSANALVLIPQRAGALEAGSSVTAYLL